MIYRAHSNAARGALVWQTRLLQGLVLVAALNVGSAFADTVVWIGRPTVRDYMAYSARRAFEQFQQLQQQMAAFNSQIADARQAYFAASPANRAAAGDKFGEMLLQKDMLIAMPKVIGGDGDMGKSVTAIMTLANGGAEPDGGIPPSARAAFGQWVSALQMRSGGSFGRIPDPVKASQALLEGGNLTAYEQYRRLRDQAEIDEIEAQRTGSARKLVGHGIIQARSFIGTTDAKGLDNRLSTLSEKLLGCTYAGLSPNYYFWQGQPPQDITSILAMNSSVHNGTLDRLKDHAATECPADDKLASALASAPLKEPLTPQALKDGRANAQTIPLTPEQQAQQEMYRKRADDHKAELNTKADAFRACSDALRASRLTRDPAAARAANQANLQCNAEARRKYDADPAPGRLDDGAVKRMASKACRDEYRAAMKPGWDRAAVTARANECMRAIK